MRQIALRSLATAMVLGVGVIGPVWAADPDPVLVKQGEYLMRAGDCIACHTGPGARPFSGGLDMATPFGTISTPNITPDKDTGIGNWSDDQFYDAMHKGVDDEGHYLYPVFPFPWYTKVTRADALSIKAYLFSLDPVHAPRKPIRLSFPFSVREALLGWRTAFFKAAEFKPDPSQSAQHNRGAYLVEGLGHCGECHNQNNILGASDWSGKLHGGEIDGWYAPNITSDGREGVGNWSAQEIVTYLRTGVGPGKSVALGPMMETINDSLKYLSDDDLNAIAVYLKSFSPKTGYKPMDATQEASTGTQTGGTYLAFCASCHGIDGKGVSPAIPALAGNGAVTAQGPHDVIRAVLGGLEANENFGPMPAFGVTMTDQQVAEAVNYVRTAWGNGAPANAEPGLVGKLRAKSSTPMSVTSAKDCTSPVAGPVLAKAIADSGLVDTLKGVPLANMLGPIDTLLPKIMAEAPGARIDEVVNAVTVAYCPLAMTDTSVAAADRTVQLGSFASLVYGQATMGRNGVTKN